MPVHPSFRQFTSNPPHTNKAGDLWAQHVLLPSVKKQVPAALTWRVGEKGAFQWTAALPGPGWCCTSPAADCSQHQRLGCPQMMEAGNDSSVPACLHRTPQTASPLAHYYVFVKNARFSSSPIYFSFGVVSFCGPCTRNSHDCTAPSKAVLPPQKGLGELGAWGAFSRGVMSVNLLLCSQH